MTFDHADDVLLETDLDRERDDDEPDEQLEERIRRALENARSVGEENEDAASTPGADEL